MKNNIKVQRAIAGLTQADLAEKTGVSRQTVNAIEKGKFVPSLDGAGAQDVQRLWQGARRGVSTGRLRLGEVAPHTHIVDKS